MNKWEEKQIKDLATAFSGYAFSASELVNEGIPVLKIGNIGANKVSKDTDSYYSGSITDKLSKYLLGNDDFLIAMTGAGSVGKPGKMFRKEKEYLVNQRVAIVRNNENADGVFLYYWFTFPFVERYLYSLGIGAGQPNISAKDILNIKLKVPNLSTQKRIADVLSTYDDLIENNSKRIVLLEKAAQELYKEWFVRFRFPGHENTKLVNGLPEGWEVKKVKDLVKRLPFGKLYKECDVNKDGKVIVIDQSRSEYIGFHNDKPSHIASVEQPIVLFGDHSCKFQLMITSFSLSENVVPFIGKDDILSAYLYYVVKDLIETTEYKRHWTELGSKKVLVADSKLQNLFIENTNDNFILVEKLKLQNRNLIKQRDLLLPRLMSGKLEV